jgi:hypothetical protein
VGILEEILATQKEILAALSGGTVSKAGTATDKPKGTTGTTTKKATGPTLETVQDKIRALAEVDGNKELIKAAIVKLGGKRAGDFEGDTAKLTKLLAALEEIESGSGDDSAEEDDDLL